MRKTPKFRKNDKPVEAVVKQLDAALQRDTQRGRRGMTAMGATPYEIMRAIPFDLPPKEFNPSEATEDSLRRYGFPVGPWRGSWKRTCSLIQPAFGKSEQTKRHYFEKAGDWAGVEVMAPEGDTIDAVRAVWTNPTAYFP